MAITDRTGLIINYLSLGALAVSGILINTIIASSYDASVLGVFSQGFVVYLLASQFGVLGIHYSALRSVAQNVDNPFELVQVVTSGLVATLSLSSIVCVLLFWGRGLIGNLLESPEVTQTLFFVAPASALFAINKYLAAVLNGQSRMRVFALNRGLRYVLVMAVIIYASWQKWRGSDLTLSLLLAESVLLVLNSTFVFRLVRPGGLSSTWLKYHCQFGARGFFSGLLMILQSRMDLLMLGYFLNDTLVGIYSLAAVFSEGFYQLLEVVRDFMNPQLARLMGSKDRSAVENLFWGTSKLLLPASIAAGLLLTGFFYYYLQFIGFSKPQECLKVLVILLAGSALISVFVPFNAILVQAGYPALQSLMMLTGFVVNVLLNLAFIPLFGLTGAAYATVVSFIAVVVTMNIMMKRTLGYSFFGFILQRAGL